MILMYIVPSVWANNVFSARKCIMQAILWSNCTLTQVLSVSKQNCSHICIQFALGKNELEFVSVGARFSYSFSSRFFPLVLNSRELLYESDILKYKLVASKINMNFRLQQSSSTTMHFYYRLTWVQLTSFIIHKAVIKSLCLVE